MESKDEVKEIDTKNRACYYFDDLIKHRNINFDHILLDKKLYEFISVYDISYKTSWIILDGFIRVCGSEFGHLVLLDYGLFDKICDNIKYFISEKSGIADSINHNF